MRRVRIAAIGKRLINLDRKERTTDYMNTRNFLIALVVGCTLVVIGCKPEPMSTTTPSASPKPKAVPGQPAALPENGFKASITLIDPPTKLQAGQKQTIKVRVKNASDVMWYARGAEFNSSSDTKFIMAAGNRWLKGADETLITEMDGRNGLDRDLKPGQETEISLVITAPKEPGEYILEVDVVQEQVTWFHEKGSPTARAKITVAK